MSVRELAIEIHKDDRYGPHPYVYHLDFTFHWSKVIHGTEFSNNNKDLIYLHDAIEDHPTCIDYLREKGVSEDRIGLLQRLNENNYSSRKEYIDSIKQGKDTVKKIKIADTMANLEESVWQGNWKRIKKYSKQLAELTGE